MSQLNASASRAHDGKIVLTLCNVDPQRLAHIQCELRGVQAAEVTGTVLTAQEMEAHNTFQEPERIKPTAFQAI